MLKIVFTLYDIHYFVIVLVTSVKCTHFGEVWIKGACFTSAAFHHGHKGL